MNIICSSYHNCCSHSFQNDKYDPIYPGQNIQLEDVELSQMQENEVEFEGSGKYFVTDVMKDDDSSFQNKVWTVSFQIMLTLDFNTRFPVIFLTRLP